MAKQALTGLRAFSTFECWVNEMVKEIEGCRYLRLGLGVYHPHSWRRKLETEVSRDH